MGSIFHLALNVTNLSVARDFYVGLLECKEGRSTSSWVDIDFFGHQLSLHLGTPCKTEITGSVGDYLVPMPHFGVILDPARFILLAEKLKQQNIDFVIPPMIRFLGKVGEQQTMFLLDPFGNPIEFKSFSSRLHVFAS